MRVFSPDYQTIYHQKLVRESLAHIFGGVEEVLIQQLLPQLEWVEIRGDEVLFRQGEEGDALFFVINGRLAAYKRGVDDKPIKLGEISKGEVVGEMAIYTNEPRSADVVALRDSVLVKLSQQVYENFASQHAALTMRVLRLMVQRLKSERQPRPIIKPVNICWVSLHPSLEEEPVLHTFHEQLQKEGSSVHIHSAYVDETLGVASISQSEQSDEEHSLRLASWLNELELQHDYVLYQCDASNTAWTQRCVRQADIVVLVADAREHSGLTPLEQQIRQDTRAAQVLLLVHPPSTRMPKNTRAWLDVRQVHAHYHVRSDNPSDWDRTVRLLTGRGIGFVLSGGGAKGFAHLGVYRALTEFGIPVDCIGGTSAGAMMGAAMAMCADAQTLIEIMSSAPKHYPTKDFNVYPAISLVRGKRMHRMLSTTIRAYSGQEDLDLSDTWLPMFLVTSNYTRAEEVVHTKGLMLNLLKATGAVPGVFPPSIIDNDLHVDGGVFNNFPVDVMARYNVQRIIGSDFRVEKDYKLDIEEVPSAMMLLLDRLRSRKKRRYRLPSLASILMNTSVLNSNARRRDSLDLLDLHINPPVSRYSFASWSAYDDLVSIGYQHTKKQLEGLSEEQLNRFNRRSCFPLSGTAQP